MKTPIRILAVLALALSFFVSASAQTSTTGSIEGTVVDVNGAAVPGVTVTATSPNLIRPQSATTNEEGVYRLSNLPPGRYTVVVEASQGFARFEQTNVEVNLSRTSTVAVSLRPAGAAETVEVTASSGAAIDVTTNTTGTNVSTEQFSNFPTQRTVQSLYTIAPTVSRSGLRDSSGRDRDPSVAGSSGPENNYILDGITVTDPAFGGSGANLPFEFVQEVEIKTGAFSAEYGKSTGGIFNVITKSGGNEFRGDVFGYVTTKGMVRETEQFSFTGSAPNGFSEVDAGFDLGGPIIKDKLWFFGAFNPQQRKNFFLTQTFRDEVENEVTTPFYSGKVTWGINQNHTLTFSTFGDFSKEEGFLYGSANLGVSGFGNDPSSFRGRIERGGSNYTTRLNSVFTPNFIGEFAFGLHLQRLNTLPEDATDPLITDNFAILAANGTVAPVTQTNIAGQTVACTRTVNGQSVDDPACTTGFVSYVNSPGGSLQRNFIQQGFGLFSTQDRNRTEFLGRLQNIFGKHTLKYGFEFNRNKYVIDQRSTGPDRTFPNSLGLPFAGGFTDTNQTNGYRVTNSFTVCTTRGTTIVCPGAAAAARAAAIAASAGYTGAVATNPAGGVPNLTLAEAQNNPFLILLSTRIRDFQLVADTYTDVESFYVQDEFKPTRNLQLILGLRWDYQQARGNFGESYLKLNDFIANMQPRLGFSWDFTGNGRGKVFANFARFVEAPIPLDVNVRAGSEESQTDKNFNVSRYGGVNTDAFIVPGRTIANLGAHATPIDPGLSPQTVDDYTVGIEYEVVKDLALGFRGVYRAQDNVIEDGSFNQGVDYFLFNPGRRVGQDVTTEDLACVQFNACFGPARRYYRALEFTAQKRFTNNYQFIASYVYSSLIGNYEGLFRNDNGQSDPNITSLFDLVSLLNGLYGRLPNDRPHQFKFDGSYRTPFRLMVSGSFRAQSGIPFNQLIPDVDYGDNEGFGVPRGTAVVPPTAQAPASFPNVVDSVGSNRTPTTWNLDLGAYYPINFGEDRQLRFQVDWFNVFNNQRAIRLDETFEITSGVNGVPNVPNPFYGSGRIFQFPSSLRLGAKFSF
ncbi:MAG TPA: TonB-dependent receptor [Pyrinomonadaceae bacterium]|nr:TonB-dependent receptor [Pyrinomonadaceae bacterium]